MKKTLLFVAGVAIAAPSIAVADDAELYIAVRGGMTNTDIDSYFIPAQGTSYNKRDKAISVLIGSSFRVNEDFSIGIESGFGYLGKYSFKNQGEKLDFDASSAEIALVATIHANDSVAFFLRGGLSVWGAKAKYSGSMGSGSETDNGTSGLFGGGALIGSGPTKFRVGVDVQKVDEVEVGTYTVGVQHLF